MPRESEVKIIREYTAIIKKHAPNWRRARYECLKAIVMKLSYEVDTSVAGLSYNLDQRYNRWKKMLDDEKKALAALAVIPAFDSEESRPPYFYNDMLSNPRKL